MVAALPVNDQFQIVADDVDNDLGYDGANDLLARLRGRTGTGPRSRQILTECHKPLAVRVGQCWPFISIEAIDLAFTAHGNQALVPAPLQFTGHQPVLRVGGVVLTLCSGRLVASLLESQFELTFFVRELSAARFDRGQRRLDAQGLKPLQYFLGKHPVDAHPAESDAARCRKLVEGTDALVAMGLAVANAKLLAAPGTAEQAGQQGFSGAYSTAAQEPLAVGVIGDQLLVPLELGPGNVALVVVTDQNLPAAPVALHAPDHALAPILDRHPRGPAAERVGTGIDRVGQHVVNRRIHGQAPDDPVSGSAVAQSGQADLLLSAPHQDLANRLKLRKLAKHQRDGGLDAPIRVLLDAVAAGLRIADGHSEEELAPAGLLLHRLDRALAENRKLHLSTPETNCIV